MVQPGTMGWIFACYCLSGPVRARAANTVEAQCDSRQHLGREWRFDDAERRLAVAASTRKTMRFCY